jgi:hypothetical protein
VSAYAGAIAFLPWPPAVGVLLAAVHVIGRRT